MLKISKHIPLSIRDYCITDWEKCQKSYVIFYYPEIS